VSGVYRSNLKILGQTGGTTGLGRGYTGAIGFRGGTGIRIGYTAITAGSDITVPAQLNSLAYFTLALTSGTILSTIATSLLPSQKAIIFITVVSNAQAIISSNIQNIQLNIIRDTTFTYGMLILSCSTSRVFGKFIQFY
jgi:hypothetical protein